MSLHFEGQALRLRCELRYVIPIPELPVYRSKRFGSIYVSLQFWFGTNCAIYVSDSLHDLGATTCHSADIPSPTGRGNAAKRDANQRPCVSKSIRDACSCRTARNAVRTHRWTCSGSYSACAQLGHGDSAINVQSRKTHAHAVVVTDLSKLCSD
jgi:hypothetical protein